MVLDPAVLRVILNVPTPELSVAAAGKAAALSDEVIETELAKDVAVLP